MRTDAENGPGEENYEKRMMKRIVRGMSWMWRRGFKKHERKKVKR